MHIRKMKRKSTAIVLVLIMIFNLLPISSFIIPVHAESGGFVFYRIKTKSTTGVDTETMQLRITRDAIPFSRPLVEVTTDGVKKFITPKTWSEMEIVIDQKDMTDPLDRVIFYAGKKTIRVLNNGNTAEEVFSTKEFAMSGNVPSMSSLNTVNGAIYVGQNLVITGDDFTGVNKVKVAGQEYTPAVVPASPNSGEFVITDPSHIVVYGVKGSSESGIGSIYLFKDADIVSGGQYNSCIQSIYLNSVEVIKPISSADLNIIDVRPDTGPISGGTIVRLVAEIGKDSMLTDNLNVYFPRVLQAGLEPLSTNNKAQIVGMETGPNKEKILKVKTPKASSIGAARIVIRSSDNKSEMTVDKQFNYIEATRALVLRNIAPTSIMKAGDTTASREVYLDGENIGTISIDGLEPVDLMAPTSLIYDNTTGILTAKYSARYNNQDVTLTRKTDITIGSKVKVMLGQTDKFSSGTSFTTSKDTLHIEIPVITLEANEESRAVDINAHTLTTINKGSDTIYQREEEYTLPKAFTFIANYITPKIDTITPVEGPYNTEIFAEIKGSNFLVLQEGINKKYPKVEIGVKAIGRQEGDADIKLWVIDSTTNKEVDGSPTNSRGDTIKIVIPATPFGVAGISVDVKVTNPDGGTPVIKEKIFKFTDPAPGTIPSIGEVKPNIAPVTGGTDIKVIGSGFRQGAFVTIDGVSVNNLKINGAGTEMTFKTPIGREGKTRLQIMNPQGGGIAWTEFEYTVIYTSPKITKVSPNSGSKGTIVTITGDSFLLPDATADLNEIYKIIGSRILFDDTGEPYDLNEYNLQDGKIVLKEFNSGKNILSLDGITPVYNEEYSGAILQDKASSKLYFMYKDYQQNIMLKDWQGALYKVEYEGLGTGSKMVLLKSTGGVSTEIEQSTTPVSSGAQLSFSLDGGATDINLVAITPYKIEGAEGTQTITGQRVRVLDEKRIEIIIPEGLKEGKKDVTIINPDTASFTVKDGFTYFSNPNGSKPVIYEVAPDQGTVAGGTIIKITGKDFRQGAEVYFGSEKSPSALVNERGDTIKAVLPSYPGDLRRDKGTDHIDVPVVVINKSDGGTAAWKERFIYRVPTSYPVITTVDPNKGSSYGDIRVVILGDNFVEYGEPYTDTNGNGSWDEGEPYTDFDINGNGYPDDENKGNGKRDIGCTHEFVDPVNGTIKKVIPKLAPKVYFGGEEAEVIDYGYRRLVVNLPRYDSQGAVDVVVVNPDTGTVVKKSGFTYTSSSPKISSVIPDSGPKTGGTEISIIGQEFIIGDAADPNSLIQVFIGDDKDIGSSLIVGGKLADPVEISNLSVDYDSTKAADNTEFKVTYSIKTKDGSIKNVIATQYSHIIQDKKEYFVTFDPTPSANMFKNEDGTDLSPEDYAALNGIAFGKEGVKAVIRDGVLTVTRRLAQILTNSSSDTLLVIKTPPSNSTIIKDLIVTNNDGGNVTSKFEYGNPLSKPRIDQVEPRRLVRDTVASSKYFVEVSKDGGSQITIIGKDFRDGVKVFLGDQEGRVISKSADDTTLIVEIPKANDGNIEKELKITVKNVDTASAISTSYRDGFTPPEGWLPYWFVYRDTTTSPKITSITPDKGPRSGGTKITITGDDFRDGARVFIGGVEATDVNVVRYNLIEAVTSPMAVAGTYTVEVKNYESGIISGTASLANGFTYVSMPNILALYEAAGIDSKGDYTKGAQTTSLINTGGQDMLLEVEDIIGNPTVVIGGKLETIADYGKIPTGVRGTDASGKDVVLTGGTNAQIIKLQGKTYIVIKTPAGDEGPSNIMIVNADGSISEPFSITYTRSLPGKPANVRAEAVDGDTVKLEWEGTVDMYQIHASFGDKSSAKELKDFTYVMTVEPERLTGGRLRCYVRGLMTETYYIFKVASVNDFGVSEEYGQSNKVKTPETINSEAKYNDEYISPAARTDWTQSTKDKFIYNIGEKSLKEGPQYYQIELRNKKMEASANRVVKIPVTLVQNYNKNFAIWDKDVSIKFETTALKTDEIMNISSGNKNDAAAVLEIYSPKGQRYDDITLLAGRRTTIVKMAGIAFSLQNKDKTQNIIQFQVPIDVTITIDPKYANNENLELYYYNLTSNKLEKINFTKKPGAITITTKITKTGEYVIIVK